MPKYSVSAVLFIFLLAFGCAKESEKPEEPLKETPNATVFFASFDSLVYAVNANNGSVKWTFKPAHYCVSSPTYLDGTVFIGCMDSSFYAIDAAKGTLLWKYKTDGAIVSSPLVKDGVVYFGSRDGNVYGLTSKAGALIWKLKLGASAYGTPSLSNNILYIAADTRNGSISQSSLIAIDAITGTKNGEKRQHLSSLIAAYVRI